jgi:hypothetical protein
MAIDGSIISIYTLAVSSITFSSQIFLCSETPIDVAVFPDVFKSLKLGVLTKFVSTNLTYHAIH